MYTAVAAVVVVVIVIAAVAWYMTGDKGGDDTGEGDTYYFYLDGFNDEINGWHSANGKTITEAFDAAMVADGIEYKMDSYGMITIEDFVAHSEGSEETGYTGTGTSVFLWTSVDPTFNEYSNYFVAGPTLSNVTSNIVYLSYSSYHFEGAQTIYDLTPGTTEADLITGGPFAENSGYEPLTYSGQFSFYLDGFNDEINGWYVANGDTITEAFDAAMSSAGIEYKMDSYGMITIEDFVAHSEGSAETGYTGTGTSVYLWTSTDLTFNQYSNYFGAGPTLSDVTSNIVYLSYSSYHFEGAQTIYDLNPGTTEADLITGGPFATA